MNEWNYDMEAAPKDRMLGFTYNDVMYVGDPPKPAFAYGWWTVGGWHYYALPSGANSVCQPYAWMELSPAPLPEIPE